MPYIISNIKGNNIPNIKINHIVIIDNKNIIKEINNIITIYPQLLKKYSKCVTFDKLYLITTHPKIKVSEITINNIFTAFQKIIYNNKFEESDTDIHYEILNECNKLISEQYKNEIILFTYLNYHMSEQAQSCLNTLANNPNNNISIITDLNYINCDKVSKIIISDFYDNISEGYEHIITNGLFLTEPLTDKIVEIDLKTTTFYGTPLTKINININAFDSILINDMIENITINNEIVNLENSFMSQTQIDATSDILTHMINTNIVPETCLVDACEFLIYLINNDQIHDKNIYVFIKETLLKIINSKNNENRSKSIILYNLIRQSFNKILMKEINTNILSDENNKIIFEYGKNSYSLATKNVSHNNIFKNIETINAKTNTDMKQITTFINDHEMSNDIKFNESCEFYNSSITLSNWFEELQNNSGIGLLMQIDSKYTSSGYFSHIDISNITNTFFPVIDYVCIIKEYFEKNQDIKFGNLNRANIINGAAIGDANAIIPLYINKYHWKIVSQYLNPLLGIIVKHNPFDYTNNLKSILFEIFAKMTTKLYCNNENFHNETFIKIYMAYLRTCAEVCFENKFNHGIKKIISSYLTEPQFRIFKDKSMFYKMCSQTLITGYILNDSDIKIIIQYLVEELIRLTVKFNKYDMDYIKYYNELQMNDREMEDISLLQSINTKISNDLEFLLAFYKMNTNFDILIKQYGSYNKFIKALDENYSIVNKDIIDKLLQLTINNEINHVTIEQLYSILGIQYNKYNILMYIFQGIAQKTNKIRSEQITKNNYIDIQKVNTTEVSFNQYITKLLNP
ncbi:hypothetical protein QKU48_gp0658 [Fadolivirus algeromassiliense]|jgi:hypothetical protein|uniref:Uncharacterized protein n=1 Tax=Fadolivirus FV1/VV64 TaxID=3070911 RepID=A0A7D3V7L6_9VIRU|nr:hypothetical protein QKU48_gp0658 [Fadolivirus algeromassiliense]QKF94116.1 hypothetical protein Fadolivirus_1_658 [Fadolivirus FV1/VV64]